MNFSTFCSRTLSLSLFDPDKSPINLNKLDNLQFARKSNDEVETIITFDNDRRLVNVYTTRNATARKLLKSLRKPYNIEYLSDEIYSMEWNIPFDDRLGIRKVLSINNFFLFL